MNASALNLGLSVAAIVALLCVSVGVAALSRKLPMSKRLAYLLFPVSQLMLALFAFWGVGTFELDTGVVAAVAAAALLSAAYDVFLFRNISVAERDKEAAYTAQLLAEQIDAQAQHAELLATDAQRASEVRMRIREQVERVSQALDAKDADEAQALLGSAAEVLRTPAGHFCAHPVVDALLAAKAPRCRELGVPLDIQACVPAGLSLPDIDLCAVFANLLDNAINASVYLKELQDSGAAPETDGAGGHSPFIQLEAFVNVGCLSVRVRNAYASENSAAPAPGTHRASTSHLAEHGWGTSIVERIASRHTGTVRINAGKGIYEVEVILQMG